MLSKLVLSPSKEESTLKGKILLCLEQIFTLNGYLFQGR